MSLNIWWQCSQQICAVYSVHCKHCIYIFVQCTNGMQRHTHTHTYKPSSRPLTQAHVKSTLAGSANPKCISRAISCPSGERACVCVCVRACMLVSVCRCGPVLALYDQNANELGLIHSGLRIQLNPQWYTLRSVTLPSCSNKVNLSSV